MVPNAKDSAVYDRYSYGRSNPIKYNDPSGHCSNISNNSQTCQDYWAAYTSYWKQYLMKKTYLFTNCGWGSGISCEATPYYGKSPLSPIREKYVQKGGNKDDVKSNGFLGKGNPDKVVEGELIYSQIMGVLKENQNARIYLVAHSAGTDATVFALNKLAEKNPERVGNIAGVAILDIDLADDDNKKTVSDTEGVRFAETYGGKVYYGRSKDYIDVAYPVSDSLVHNYLNLDHQELAIDPFVIQDIINAIGW
jgi:hypothetical protein